MDPLIVWYFSVAFFCVGVLFFYQNLQLRKEIRQIHEDIFNFRKDLIKLVSADRKRRRF